MSDPLKPNLSGKKLFYMKVGLIPVRPTLTKMFRTPIGEGVSSRGAATLAFFNTSQHSKLMKVK